MKESIKKVQDEFLVKINEVYDKCVSRDTYANVTEFYDEDGVVLMTVEEPDGKPGKLIFSFSENGESFEYDKTEEKENSKLLV